MKTKQIALATTLALFSSMAIAASPETKAFIASHTGFDVAQVTMDTGSNPKRCGAAWKNNKASLAQDGWTWPRYSSACQAAIKAK